MNRLYAVVHEHAAKHFHAFFSSELGGITTQPALMTVHMASFPSLGLPLAPDTLPSLQTQPLQLLFLNASEGAHASFNLLTILE